MENIFKSQKFKRTAAAGLAAVAMLTTGGCAKKIKNEKIDINSPEYIDKMLDGAFAVEEVRCSNGWLSCIYDWGEMTVHFIDNNNDEEWRHYLIDKDTAQHAKEVTTDYKGNEFDFDTFENFTNTSGLGIANHSHYDGPSSFEVNDITCQNGNVDCIYDHEEMTVRFTNPTNNNQEWRSYWLSSQKADRAKHHIESLEGQEFNYDEYEKLSGINFSSYSNNVECENGNLSLRHYNGKYLTNGFIVFLDLDGNYESRSYNVDVENIPALEDYTLSCSGKEFDYDTLESSFGLESINEKSK